MRTTIYRCVFRAPASLTQRLCAAALCACLAYGASVETASANDNNASSPTLADAWLETLPQLSAPVNWAYSYALLDSDQARFEQEQRYLIEELNTLIVSAQVAGHTARLQTVAAWRDTLRTRLGEGLRSPGRMDLPTMGANLREAPQLSRVAHWGACQLPSWVEVWGLHGVTRLAWQPNMSLDALANTINPQAFTGIDYVHLITPQGTMLRRGIAAWNYADAPLAPGSRLIIELPNRQGLTGALPFPGTTHELDIVNKRLPGVLAAQLPGDECTQWQAH